MFQFVFSSWVSNAWGAFGFCAAISLVISYVFVRVYWNRREYKLLSALPVILGMCLALITSLLLPVDVFCISSMKSPDGTFKSWATNTTREYVKDSMSYIYIVIASTILFFLFFVLPFFFWSYDQVDENLQRTTKSYCRALLITIGFVALAAVLWLTGAFLPYETAERWLMGSKGIRRELSEQRELSALSRWSGSDKIIDGFLFLMNVVTCIGMITLVLYTGFGLSSAAICAVRSSRKACVRPMSSWCFYFCGCVGIFAAIVCGSFGFFFWINLLMINIEKIKVSKDIRYGYFFEVMEHFSPFDKLMLALYQGFPSDFFFYGIVTFLLITCTISGVKYIGIWFCCFRAYQVRRAATPPQAMLVLCLVLLYTGLALNVLLFLAVPQYTSFGNQAYRTYNETTKVYEILPCSNDAPETECTMSRMSFWIMNYINKAPFFGNVYFYLSWCFLGSTVVAFFVVMLRRSHSSSNGRDEDELEESDEEDQRLISEAA